MTAQITHSDPAEIRVDAMWSLDDDARRLAIIRRAAAGARKALSGKV